MSFPEQDRAVQILEKEFGPRWKQIVQELGTKELRQRVGKELTSFMAFPERGSGGNNKWRGNCSPEVVRAILRYVLECKHYYPRKGQAQDRSYFERQAQQVGRYKDLGMPHQA